MKSLIKKILNEVNVPHHYQPTGHSCGPTCLKMVHDFFVGDRFKISDICRACGTDWVVGTPPDRMAKGLKYMGIEYVEHMMDEDPFQALKDAIDKGHPSVVRTVTQGVPHWIIVVDYDADTFMVNDPWLGRILYDTEEFDDIWFFMNHRSNMDYILVAYLASTRTALSYAVGEWARVWPLQTLLRAMGAYFVRRRSRDPLYRKVLARYVHMATAAGVTQAVYPEGELSRDGRLGAPRLGILDYMLRSFDPAGERDLVFIPVGINYDRVLEDRTLLLGGGKERLELPVLRTAAVTVRFAMRSFGQMLAGTWHRFGYVCTSFGSPLSMRQYCHELEVNPTRLDRDQRFGFVERESATSSWLAWPG